MKVRKLAEATDEFLSLQNFIYALPMIFRRFKILFMDPRINSRRFEILFMALQIINNSGKFYLLIFE